MAYPRLTIALSTYATNVYVASRLLECIRSLEASGFPGRIIVVDDGSKERRRVRTLTASSEHSTEPARTMPVELYQRSENGGIARCKNSCLKLIEEEPYEIGFLANDDLIFFRDWWVPYVDAIRITKHPHFCWSDHTKGTAAFKLNECVVYKTRQLDGHLMTFTPQVIQKVGGFQVCDSKWGWSHKPWTDRINRKFFPSIKKGHGLDVEGSNKVVCLQHSPSAITPQEKAAGRKVKILEEKMYVPLEE